MTVEYRQRVGALDAALRQIVSRTAWEPAFRYHIRPDRRAEQFSNPDLDAFIERFDGNILAQRLPDQTYDQRDYRLTVGCALRMGEPMGDEHVPAVYRDTRTGHDYVAAYALEATGQTIDMSEEVERFFTCRQTGILRFAGVDVADDTADTGLATITTNSDGIVQVVNQLLPGSHLHGPAGYAAEDFIPYPDAMSVGEDTLRALELEVPRLLDVVRITESPWQ